ncbi:MAG: transketolase family protein, partial [Clostridiaceae bacterium]|nr:transketolase family protein [Clostridiaceae bacterium]
MYKVVKEIRPEAAEMRTAFATTMDELAAQDNSVVYFDCDVNNSIGMTGFFKKYPDRCVDCGIQESNMIGAAAGASTVGLKPFTHTFGPFAARRVIDQVYISAA